MLRLGIDTGGTYTDAALVENDKVIGSAKALTTHHDLTLGIGEALSRLPGEVYDRVSMVSLSTTLATNAVVESRGAPCCLILAGYRDRQIARSRVEEILRGGPLITLAGAHDASGRESAELDIEGAKAAILKCRDEVASFGISTLFSVRNPAHENQLKQLVVSLTDKPVTCGHELASELNAVRRAVTVAFNASLIPFIDRLIRSVRKILNDHQIKAPLMVVKGDGSLVTAEAALDRPVETILSGPAASVVGASHLSDVDDAIVADMGGTTTDIAVVSRGQPVRRPSRSAIGGWHPMIDSLRVFSVGLGGDSEVRFQGGVGIGIGPRRMVPISLAAQQHPEIVDSLQAQVAEPSNPRHNRFALRMQNFDAPAMSLTEDEHAALNRLENGPLDLSRVAIEDRACARAVARLVRKGMVIFTGFTPSDAAHVLGLSSHWSLPAAELGAVIWARQMRQIYGWGDWPNNDPVAPSKAVHEKVISTIAETVLKACLESHDKELDRTDLDRLATVFTRWSAESNRQNPDDEPLFSVSLGKGHTLVAVGAPAYCYYPEVARRLGIAVDIPAHAEIANAVGAVIGSVIQRERITITQPTAAVFRLHSRRGTRDFDSLDLAVAAAEADASEMAAESAIAAGADAVETALQHEQDLVDDPLDGQVFFEMRVTAVASGRPRFEPGTAP